MSERDPLSMSTDNTPEGEIYSDTVEGGPISQVMIGDRVVDSTGKEVGKVKFVKMGDPNAATDEGRTTTTRESWGLVVTCMTWVTFPSRSPPVLAGRFHPHRRVMGQRSLCRRRSDRPRRKQHGLPFGSGGQSDLGDAVARFNRWQRGPCSE